MDSLSAAALDGSSLTLLGFNGTTDATAISSCGENLRGGIKPAEIAYTVSIARE